MLFGTVKCPVSSLEAPPNQRVPIHVPLVVVITMGVGVINSAHIHDNVT